MGDRKATRARERALEVDRILTKKYGEKSMSGRRSSPLDTLMLTILSQNTNDVNRDRAYRSLKKSYPHWEDLLHADPRMVEKAIRVGGLGKIKSRRLIDVLRFIERDRGDLSLSFLRSMTLSEVNAWLSQMKGVGPKTRAIVMLFSLGLPAFPVDTHVHRVTRRLGLIGPKVSRERAQEMLAAVVPESEYYNFHINLIEHGRAICISRKPRCPVCPVRHLCDYYRTVFLKGHS